MVETPPEGDHAPGLEITHLPDIVKGKSDWRCFRAVRLPNGTTCVLVNDKESKTTAMAVCVNIGASADPRELSGLAHFTEHMCFLGSEKYPGENEYKRYLSCHGGRSNASTSMTYTTYKFDVLAEHAENAVDIFSNFFVNPLFTESGTSREVNAVDSENSKNLTADSRRRLQILKALADPDHHWSKFSTGNALTLPAAAKGKDGEENAAEAKKMREALLAFHRRHYRPSNMTVVVVGPQSLDTLQEWVVPKFAPIVDRWSEREASGDRTEIDSLIDAAARDVPANGFDQPAPPYNPAFLPKVLGGKWPVLLTTLPLRSMRKLVLMFPLPSVQKTPDRSPSSILSHLLGHEGPGSSFAALQDAGLLNSLVAGSRISAPDQCLFYVDLGLTEQGEARWKEVVHVILEHCRLIAGTAAAAKEKSKNKTDNTAFKSLQVTWEEVCELSRMEFHQTSPGSAYDFAPRLAQSVVTHGVDKCLSAGSMLDEKSDTIPLEDLVDFSSRLVPTNCIIERCSQGAWDEQKKLTDVESESAHDSAHFGLKKEKWYGVEYYLSDICANDVTRWERDRGFGDNRDDEKVPIGRVHLPRPNRYIPRSLDLCRDLPVDATSPRIEKKIDPPKLLLDDSDGRLWHRLDDRYALPKSSLTLLMRNPAVENVQGTVNDSWDYDIETNMRSLLLTGVFSDALAQDTYDANLAGLYWSLSKSPSGITLSCSGYSDRLPDLALKLLRDFLLPGSDEEKSFMNESHLAAVKDRTIRSLKSYFQSRRADSHAMYYRDLLMSSKGEGIGKSLAAADAATLDSVKEQHGRILQNSLGFEILFTGNVSEVEAKKFFEDACDLRRQASVSMGNKGKQSKDSLAKSTWAPGPFERRLNGDVEMHFASKNPEEENGCLLVTYQSQVPGFRGAGLSTEKSLKHSAAIRVLCHMLREPLFDELRTKQQLGYIVSSYYDIGFSTREPSWGDQSSDLTSSSFLPSTTPLDFIVVNILSRKLSPPEIALRLDECLGTFRESLGTMPESEIRDHADALSQKLLKPIQKLGTEAGTHFGKIRRYAPEVLSGGGTGEDLPWNSVEVLARKVEGMQREDLLNVWDSVVAGKSRSRVVSCVYGSTFPLDATGIPAPGATTRGAPPPQVVKSMEEIFQTRSQLMSYDPEKRTKQRGLLRGLVHTLGGKRNASIAAVALIGIGGAIGLSVFSRGVKDRNSKK